MNVSDANSISAIAALIQAAQVPRPANRPGDGPYFGSPSDAPAQSSEPVDATQWRARIAGLDSVAVAGTPQPSVSAAGLAAYAENSSS